MPTISTSVRGIRNANPGNLRRDKTKWQGLRSVQTDPSFFQFESMAWGIRALTMTLITYRNKYHFHTVHDILHRYAPACENDTSNYVANVSKRLGVTPDDPIDTSHSDVMFSLVRAIIRQEVGAISALLVSDLTVRLGIEMAPGVGRTP